MDNEKCFSLIKFGIEEKLKNIWANYYKDEYCISPIYQENLLKNAITYISLNPSSNLKAQNTEKVKEMSIKSYPMIDCNTKNPHHPHYNKFFEIENFINQPWTAIEMLYIRNSNQKEIKNEKAEFVIQQMKITFDILNNINPKIVIVANSYVDILIHNFSDELNLKMEQPSKENGYTYLINSIPFIIKESKFMGSRILWAKEQKRKDNLNEEILRILNQIKK